MSDKSKAAAERGAADLIERLRKTGTGKPKLAAAAEADLSGASTELEGAAAVRHHLAAVGAPLGTLAKCDAYLAELQARRPAQPQRSAVPPAEKSDANPRADSRADARADGAKGSGQR